MPPQHRPSPPVAAAAPGVRRAQTAWTLVIAAVWMHTTALAIFAYGAGGAGAVGFALVIRSIPALFGTPLTGAAARLPLHVTLPGSGVLGAVALAGSAVAAAMGAVGCTYALGALVTLAAMLFRQAHTALLPSLAPGGRQLTGANATATAIESAGMVLGPALAGAVFAVASVPMALVVAGALSLAAAAVSTSSAPRVPGATGRRRAPRIGVRQAAAEPAVRLLLGLLLVQTVVSGVLNVLFVVCAVELLDLGREGTTVLTVAFGAGGLLGGLTALVRARGADLVTWLRAGLVLWGLPLVALGLLPDPTAAVSLIAVVGVGNAFFDIASVTLLQRAVEGAALARVLGLVETVVVAGLAVGGIAASVAVAQLGVQGALLVTGAVLPLVLLASYRPVGRLAAAPAPA